MKTISEHDGRMPSHNESSLLRFHGLDTLRASAILVVMLYHLSIAGLLPEALRPVASIGWIGVDLFFVLSGFLIGSQLLKPYLDVSAPSLKDFYSRRAYRILPAYFVVLILYLLAPLWREAPGPYAPWQYITFLWNLLLLHYPDDRAFSHVWSLCVEEHFYLLLPLLVIVFMRKPAVWKTICLIGGIFVGGMVVRAWLLHYFVLAAKVPEGEQRLMVMRYIYYPTYARLDGLVVGVSLAVLRTFRPTWFLRISGYGNILFAIGLAMVAGALSLCDFGFPCPDLRGSILFAFPALALGFGLMVAAAVDAKGLLTWRVPGAKTVATLAFSLYLTHKSVAHATHRLLPGLTRNEDWRALCLYFVACFAFASLLYFAVERPCLLIRSKRAKRREIAASVDMEIRLDPAI